MCINLINNGGLYQVAIVGAVQKTSMQLSRRKYYAILLKVFAVTSNRGLLIVGSIIWERLVDDQENFVILGRQTIGRG